VRCPRRTLLSLLVATAGVCPAPVTACQLPDTIAGVVYHELAGPRTRTLFAPGDSLIAVRVRDILEHEAPLPGLPDSLPSGVSVTLTASEAAFDAVAGTSVPEWRAAVSIPGRSLMVVPTREGRSLVDVEGRRTLRHEWAHLGLHQYLGGSLIPRWFDEGYAEWASGGWDASRAWRLRILLALGRTPPLDSLSLAWPRDEVSAEAAYLLGASAVAFLLQESGPRGLRLFLERWRSSHSFETALRSTFGLTSGQFEEAWRRDVRKRYGWLFVFSHSAVFWMAMALLLLVIVRLRRRQNREHLARLRAEEIPDRPAFWSGESERDGHEEDPPGVEGPGESQ
jgi:Peptidase MA superfamily